MQNMAGNQIQLRSVKPGNGSFHMSVQKYMLELDDDTFKTFAFKTHPLAYLDGGLADLPIADLMKIAMQPNIQEWGDIRTWEQAADSGKVVLPNKVHNFYVDAVDKALGRLLAK